MAFDANFTLNVFETGDGVLKATRINGIDARVAVFPDGKELTMTINHEAKKRERHVVKLVLNIPATATTPADTVSCHIVLDQGLPPSSHEAETTAIGTTLCTWVMANLSRIQRGEI